MKKRILLFTAIAGISALTLSSYEFGPAAQGAGNLTGSPGANGNSCSGSTCHGGNSSATTVNIELDSAGVAVSSYKAGVPYTVKITGSNTSHLAKFGFQFVSATSAGAQAGTSSSLPANVRSTSFSGYSIIEHSAPLSGSNGNYALSFQWTAPAAGTGTVTMYCTLNAVNGDGSADAQDVNGNTHKAFTEQTGGTAVNSIPADVRIAAYPNPVNAQLNLKMENAGAGIYTINVFDISGKRITADHMEVTNSTFAKTINTAAWVPGYYSIQLMKDGAQRVISVVKQ